MASMDGKVVSAPHFAEQQGVDDKCQALEQRGFNKEVRTIKVSHCKIRFACSVGLHGSTPSVQQ